MPDQVSALDILKGNVDYDKKGLPVPKKKPVPVRRRLRSNPFYDEVDKATGKPHGSTAVAVGKARREEVSKLPRSLDRARRTVEAFARQNGLTDDELSLLKSTVYLAQRRKGDGLEFAPGEDENDYEVDPKAVQEIIERFKSDRKAFTQEATAQRDSFRRVAKEGGTGLNDRPPLDKTPEGGFREDAGQLVQGELLRAQIGSEQNTERYRESGSPFGRMTAKMDDASAFVSEKLGGGLPGLIGASATEAAMTLPRMLAGFVNALDPSMPADLRGWAAVDVIVNALGSGAVKAGVKGAVKGGVKEAASEVASALKSATPQSAAEAGFNGVEAAVKAADEIERAVEKGAGQTKTKDPWEMTRDELDALSYDDFRDADRAVARKWGDLYVARQRGTISEADAAVLSRMDEQSHDFHEVGRKHIAEREARQAAANQAIEVGEPWRTSREHFVGYHKTGNIDSSAYERYASSEGIDFVKRDNYPIQVDQIEVNGKTLDIRQENEPLRYVKVDADGEIVRDAKGMATYLSPEEMKAQGYQSHSAGLAIFDGDRPVGFASNEFGTAGVWVVDEFQGKGIGARLLDDFMQRHPRIKKIGQMTPSGEKMTGAYHKRLVAQALKEGKPVPPEVLADYPDIVADRATPGSARAQTDGPTAIDGLEQESAAIVARREARLSKGRPTVRQRGQTGAIGGGTRRVKQSWGPEDQAEAEAFGSVLFQRGIKDFKDFRAETLKNFGRAADPYVSGIYGKLRRSPPPDDTVERLVKNVREAKAISRDFAEGLKKKAREAQAGRLAGAIASTKGKPFGQKMSSQFGAMKGGFASFSFELPEKVSKSDLDHLGEIVDRHPRLQPFQKATAKGALQKIAGEDGFGGLPQPAEIELLERVFGKEFGNALKRTRAAAPGVLEEIALHRKAGLLSGPRTIVRNFLGNTAQAVRNKALRPADAFTDMAVSLFTKQRTTPFFVVPDAGATRRVTEQTLRDVKDVVRYGPTGGQAMTTEVFRESRNPLVRGMLRFQSAQDTAFQNMAWEDSVREQASVMSKAGLGDYDDLVMDPTEAMVEQAEISAQLATFSNPNTVASLLNAPGYGDDLAKDSAQFVIDLLFPFKKVPTNLVGMAAEANPLGMVYNLGKLLHEARTTGKVSFATQRQFSRQVTNGALGSGLWWYGFELAKEGRFTPPWQRNAANRERSETVGEPPVSVRIGDTWYSAAGLHPFLNVMAMGAASYHKQAEKERLSEDDLAQWERQGLAPPGLPGPGEPGVMDLGAGVSALGGVLQELPTLQGIKQLTQAAEGDQSWNQYLWRLGASFVPAIADDVARIAGVEDSTFRSPGSVEEAMMERGGMGRLVSPKYTGFGMERPRTDVPGPFGVLDVFNQRAVTQDPVLMFVKRHRLSVSKPERLPGENERDYQTRVRFVGSMTYQLAQAAAPHFDKYSGERAKDRWDDLRERGKELGMIWYKRWLKGGKEREEAEARLSKAPTSGPVGAGR